MVGVVTRVGELLQMTADNGLRLIWFRPDYRIESLGPTADIRIAAKKIHRTSAESKQLCEPRIIVVSLG